MNECKLYRYEFTLPAQDPRLFSLLGLPQPDADGVFSLWLESKTRLIYSQQWHGGEVVFLLDHALTFDDLGELSSKLEQVDTRTALLRISSALVSLADELRQ